MVMASMAADTEQPRVRVIAREKSHGVDESAEADAADAAAMDDEDAMVEEEGFLCCIRRSKSEFCALAALAALARHEDPATPPRAHRQ